MIVAVASGKGGTGKTTVAVSLALTRAKRVQFLDCDVEEPNAHLLLHPQMVSSEPVQLLVPVYDAGKCTRCGRCVEACVYNALALVGGELMIFESLCHGCSGCVYFCAEKALREGRREIGVVERGRAGAISFAHGKLRLGEALVPPVIAAVRRSGAAADESVDTVLDCPPGTSCPAIQAVRGVDYCLVVTEPTPFGQHDLEVVVNVLRVLHVPHGVLINRADLGDEEVENFCRAWDIPVLAKIPFDPKIARCFTTGTPFINEMPEWKKRFTRLWSEIKGVVARA